MTCQVHRCRNIRIYIRKSIGGSYLSENIQFIPWCWVFFISKRVRIWFLLNKLFPRKLIQIFETKVTSNFMGRKYVIARFEDNPCNNRNRALEINFGSLIPINSSSNTYYSLSVRYSHIWWTKGVSYLNIKVIKTEHVIKQIEELSYSGKLPHGANFIQKGWFGGVGHCYRGSVGGRPVDLRYRQGSWGEGTKGWRGWKRLIGVMATKKAKKDVDEMGE